MRRFALQVLLWIALLGVCSPVAAETASQKILLLSGGPCAGVTQAADFVNGAYCGSGRRVSSFLSIPGSTFTRASAKTALNSSGAVVSFATGVPAITDLGFLVEAAATNLLLQSAALTSATWAANAGLLSRTSGFTAPDNSTTAVKVVADTSTGQHRLGQTLTGTAAAYTVSVFAKASGYNWLVINLFDGTSANLASFNLATGAIGTLGSGSTATITAVANGFYRITVTRTMLASASTQVLFNPSSADNTISFTGDGVSGAILWGPQFELGSFASSYIVTTSGSATRAADIASIGGLTLAAPYAILVKGTLPATRIGGFPALASITASIGSAGPFVNGTSGQPGANMGAGTFNQSIGSAVAVGGTVNVGFLADVNTGSGVANGSAPVVTSGTFTPSVGAASFNIGVSSNAGGNAWNGYITRFIYWATPPSINALQTMSGQ